MKSRCGSSGKLEDEDVAARGRPGTGGAGPAPARVRREDELVDDEVVADEDGVLHRRSRHDERLDEKRADEEGEDDGDEDDLDVARAAATAAADGGPEPSAGDRGRRPSADEPEHPVPSRPREEVDRDARELPDLVDRPAPDVGVRLGLVRPVEEERPPEDVLARDRSPEAAVERVVAVVAHPEVVAGRNAVGPELVAQHARLGDARIARRVDLRVDVLDLRAVGRLPVDEERLVADLQDVAGPADGALDEDVVVVEVVARLLEDDDVAAVHVAVGERASRAPGPAAP